MSPESKKLLNILLLGVAFMFMFTAFQTCGNVAVSGGGGGRRERAPHHTPRGDGDRPPRSLSSGPGEEGLLRAPRALLPNPGARVRVRVDPWVLFPARLGAGLLLEVRQRLRRGPPSHDMGLFFKCFIDFFFLKAGKREGEG